MILKNRRLILKKNNNLGLILGVSCFLFLNIALCITNIALFVIYCDTIRDIGRAGLNVPTESIILVIFLGLLAVFLLYIGFISVWFLFDKIKTNDSIDQLSRKRCKHCLSIITDDSSKFCQNCGQQLIKENKTEKAE